MAQQHGALSQVLSSTNIFIDTSSSDFTGDDAEISLGGLTISAGDGQLLKCVLVSFAMPRVTYAVNSTNNQATLLISHAGDVHTRQIVMTPQNVGTPHVVAAQFASAVGAALADVAGGALAAPPVVLSPGTEYVDAQDAGTGIMSFGIEFTAPHDITALIIQLHADQSDSYQLLGGDAFGATTPTSLDVDVTANASRVVISGRYPMSTQTDHYVYLRSNLRSNNIETRNLSAAITTPDSQCVSSDILARIPNSFTYLHYDSEGTDQYFQYLAQKTLSNIRLRVTDHRGRPLGRPRPGNARPLTASGTGSNQSKTGNLFFSAVLRIDVIQRVHPTFLKTPIPRVIPNRAAVINQEVGGPLVNGPFV